MQRTVVIKSLFHSRIQLTEKEQQANHSADYNEKECDDNNTENEEVIENEDVPENSGDRDSRDENSMTKMTEFDDQVDDETIGDDTVWGNTALCRQW